MFNIFGKKKEQIPLPITTDIHCHIVPGVDDGSPNAQTSADLVRRMAAWGITKIIASPHVTEVTFENTPDILDPALEELQQELKRQSIPVTVSRSSENRIDDFFLSQFQQGMIVPLPGNYLLLENSWVQEPLNLEQLIFDLKVKGYNPILAHPERYPYYFSGNQERYDRLHQLGMAFQINLLSLAGHYGKREKETAEKLIEKGYVDFLGTDLHNHRHADSIDAYLTTREARRHFKALQEQGLKNIF